jgi:L-2-hydroxycarboxylate dehydrogenase (NAD+)
MAEQNVLVPVERVREFSTEILVRMGVPRDDARITTEILVAADLWGIQSHGIAHLALYHHRIKVGHQRATTDLQIVRETPTTAVADGGNGMGKSSVIE